MTALDRKRTSVAVAQHIRGLIFSAQLKSGDKIDRLEIANALKVSQIPVREAIDELTRDGLLVLEFHRGAYVAPLSAETVCEHFDLHAMITSYAAAQVVRKGRTELLREKLKQILDDFDVNGSDEPRVFYRTINAAGGGPALHAMINAFSEFVSGGLYELPEIRRSFLEEGRNLMRALESGDIQGCQEAIFGHTHYVGEMFVRQLRDRGVIVDLDD